MRKKSSMKQEKEKKEYVCQIQPAQVIHQGTKNMQN